MIKTWVVFTIVLTQMNILILANNLEEIVAAAMNVVANKINFKYKLAALYRINLNYHIIRKRGKYTKLNNTSIYSNRRVTNQFLKEVEAEYVK
jgi:hypothetical protein